MTRHAVIAPELSAQIAERNAAIAAMAIAGTPPAAIAPRFGMSPAHISAILSVARKSGVPIPLFKITDTVARDEAIIEAVLAGKNPHHIAARHKISKNRVANILSKARKNGAPVPLQRDGRHTLAARRTEGVQVRASVLALIAPAAEARHTTPVELARRIIEIVARDGMVNAVLDDGHEHREAAE